MFPHTFSSHTAQRHTHHMAHTSLSSSPQHTGTALHAPPVMQHIGHHFGTQVWQGVLSPQHTLTSIAHIHFQQAFQHCRPSSKSVSSAFASAAFFGQVAGCTSFTSFTGHFMSGRQAHPLDLIHFWAWHTTFSSPGHRQVSTQLASHNQSSSLQTGRLDKGPYFQHNSIPHKAQAFQTTKAIQTTPNFNQRFQRSPSRRPTNFVPKGLSSKPRPHIGGPTHTHKAQGCFSYSWA